MCAEQSYQSPVSESRRVKPFLVVEHESLVARPDIDLVQLRRVREIDAAGPHEADRPLDLGGDDLVALSLRRARDELLVPHLHLRQVGEAALREGAKQIERGRGLVVGLDHPRRVGGSRLRRRLRRR